MNVSCPSCGKQLKLSDKFQETLSQLKPDQKARVKCVHCQEPFAIDKSMIAADSTAVRPGAGNGPVPQQKRVTVKPPEPPDTSWLQEGVFEDQEVVEEIPLALLLVPDSCGAAAVSKALEGIGYRVERAESSQRALEKMEFVNYSGVFLHTDFEPGGLQRSAFHQAMCIMSMSRRRYIFYTLIGKELHTLYDLEALSYSANIVVNERDLPHFTTILKKTIPEYEGLFGPLMEELRVLGR